MIFVRRQNRSVSSHVFCSTQEFDNIDTENVARGKVESILRGIFLTANEEYVHLMAILGEQQLKKIYYPFFKDKKLL